MVAGHLIQVPGSKKEQKPPTSLLLRALHENHIQYFLYISVYYHCHIYIYLTQSYASLGMWLVGVYPFLNVGVCPDEIIVLMTRKEGENWYQEVTSNFSIISLYVSSLIFVETIIIIPIIEIRELKFRNGRHLPVVPKIESVEGESRPKSFFLLFQTKMGLPVTNSTFTQPVLCYCLCDPSKVLWSCFVMWCFIAYTKMNCLMNSLNGTLSSCHCKAAAASNSCPRTLT